MDRKKPTRMPVLYARCDEALHERARALAWWSHQSLAGWALGKLRPCLMARTTLDRLVEYRNAGSPDLGKGAAAKSRRKVKL